MKKCAHLSAWNKLLIIRRSDTCMNGMGKNMDVNTATVASDAHWLRRIDAKALQRNEWDEFEGIAAWSLRK